MASYRELNRGAQVSVIDAEDGSDLRTAKERCTCCRSCTVCLWIILACFYLFVLIPGGLTLIVRGQNRHDEKYLEIIGIVVLVVGVCSGPIVCVLHRWNRLRRSDSRSAKLASVARTLRPYSSPKGKSDNEQDRLAAVDT